MEGAKAPRKPSRNTVFYQNFKNKWCSVHRLNTYINTRKIKQNKKIPFRRILNHLKCGLHCVIPKDQRMERVITQRRKVTSTTLTKWSVVKPLGSHQHHESLIKWGEKRYSTLNFFPDINDPELILKSNSWKIANLESDSTKKNLPTS